MMRKLPMLILSLPKHDDAFTSTPYQLAKEFARDREVWYISHPYTLLDFVKNIRSKKAWKRFKASWVGGIVSEESSVSNLKILYLPLTLPINGLKPGRFYDFLSNLNHNSIAKVIKKLLRQQAIEDYVFVNSHDFYLGRIVDKLPKPVLNVYHCIDPIIKAYSSRHGTYLEKEAAQSSDLVIATAPFLQRKMQQYHAKSYCVPNAANFALSHQATLSETRVEPVIEKIHGPKIGYVGNIERRISFEWLTEIFSRRKEWQLIMVGPANREFVPKHFLQLPNVHMLPPVPHECLPNVLKGFDVSMIPFKKDEVSAQIYPLKLFEYMGSGKPVVTTDFNPEVLNPFLDDIYLGKDAAQLEKAIEKALNEFSEEKVERRVRVAQDNDWKARATQFSEIIDHQIDAYPNQKISPAEC